MSKIFPFQAYRYNLPNSKLKSAVCPPYDVIGEALERALRALPDNAVAVELPEGEGDAKYENARSIWEGWKEQGRVKRDARPAFYVYEQIFSVQGRRYSRKGFFCETEIEKPGEGSVLRHELTLAGPKEDRLKLLRALRMNTSPIFGLFRDPGKGVGKILAAYSKRQPPVEVKDREGVTHRLWLCSDPKETARIQAALAGTPILIADGHHRYETSWNYRQEMGGRGGAARMLFFLCPMGDPGLVIFPTHRILRDPRKLNLSGFLERLQGMSDLFELKALSASLRMFPKPPAGVSFVATDGKRFLGVKPRSLAVLRKRLAGKSEASVRLPLAHLHSLAVPEMQKEDFIYSHDQKEAVALAKKNKTLAFLLPTTSSEELDGVVSSGELMPQKSTYFYPKVITGLLFRSLE